MKHAYDGVQQWAVEVVLRRMGVPEEYVQYQAKLVVLTRTAVITPFGVTEKSRRASQKQTGGEWQLEGFSTSPGGTKPVAGKYAVGAVEPQVWVPVQGAAGTKVWLGVKLHWQGPRGV